MGGFLKQTLIKECAGYPESLYCLKTLKALWFGVQTRIGQLTRNMDGGIKCYRFIRNWLLQRRCLVKTHWQSRLIVYGQPVTDENSFISGFNHNYWRTRPPRHRYLARSQQNEYVIECTGPECSQQVDTDSEQAIRAICQQGHLGPSASTGSVVVKRDGAIAGWFLPSSFCR